MRIPALAIWPLMLLTACLPSSTLSPSGVAGGHFLVVVTRQGTDPSPAVVEILAPDGSVRARAAFDANPAWDLESNRVWYQPPARILGDAVLYVDVKGIVHSLDVSGHVGWVANLLVPADPFGGDVSFAVSPSGSQLVAALHFGSLRADERPQEFEELEAVEAKGTSRSLVTTTIAGDPPEVTQVVGWDADGPVASLLTPISGSTAPPSRHALGRELVHLQPSGRPGGVIGGLDCQPLDLDAQGDVLCEAPAIDTPSSLRLAVRLPDGEDLWSVPLAAANGSLLEAALSPDGLHVISNVGTMTAPAPPRLFSAKGSSALTTSGWVVGWLDRETVVMVRPRAASPGEGEGAIWDGELFTLGLSGDGQLHDLGVSGIFVGALGP